MAHPFVKKYGLIPIAAWSVLIACAIAATLYAQHQETLRDALQEARNYYRLNYHYRIWNAGIGGLYASAERVQPNPYLTLPDRDIVTTDNRMLTLVNPAYMSRLVFDMIMSDSATPIICKLTSLNPVNPANNPDEWEREALFAFERQGAKERSQALTLNGVPYLRLISRFDIEIDCLKCHERQGYKIGDLRGGISIAIPLAPFMQAEAATRNIILGSYLSLWLAGCAGLAILSRKRHEQEQSLRTNEEKFRTVCDWTEDWEYWRAPDRATIYTSPSCLRLTGYAPADFHANPALFEELVHPEDRQKWEAHLLDKSSSPTDSSCEMEFRIVARDGKVRWVGHVCRSIFAEDETYLGRRASNRDITEHKALEDQLRQAQKIESIGTLAGGIAHDYNNILTVIIGYGHVALMTMASDDPQRSNIERMLAAAERAAHLTKDLLVFSRKQISDKQLLDLNEIVRKVEEFLERVIGEDLIFKTSLGAGPIPILADGHQIEQVLMNLATNARDAMLEGGEFIIATGQILLDTEFIRVHGFGTPGRYALLTVSDNGTGMDQETRQRLFEPFYTTKAVGKGMGLGMAIVYGIVKQHEGYINVYSEPGYGTTFRIYLPVSAIPLEGEQPTVTAEAPERGSETILVAEDDEAVRKMTLSILQDYGYKVIVAIDGEDAVQKYREHQESIRLLLFDLIMPKKTGKEAYDEIRAEHPGIKVIFSSGYTADLLRIKHLIDHEQPVVFKPVSPLDLLNRVRSVLDAAPPAREGS